jgi:hypothetical protein
MSQTVRITVCPTCNKARELIEQSKPNSQFDPSAFLDSLHLLFEGALHHLLADIDYAAHPHSNAAIAARLMGAGADRMKRLMALTLPGAQAKSRSSAKATGRTTPASRPRKKVEGA